jgi:hypothetical protein
MYEEDLTNLEDWLRRLKVEYTIFFNGHRKKPPEDLKLRVEKLVKKLSEVGNMAYSERFRYNTLVTRFYVLRDLWRRTLMSRELGQNVRDAVLPSDETSTGMQEAGRDVQVTISNPDLEEDKIRKLYERLIEITARNAEQSPIAYPQFLKYVSAQAKTIQQKFGCSAVVFNVALEQDAVKFTARAKGGKQP